VRVVVEQVSVAPVKVGAVKVKPKHGQKKPLQAEEQLRPATPVDLTPVCLKEVMVMIGLERTATIERTKTAGFPKKFKPGGPDTRAVRWFKGEVQQWVIARADEEAKG
jgi:predicted DNA-binding transcriptional regulator AlpA